MASSGLAARIQAPRLPALTSTASLGGAGLVAGVIAWELGARAVHAVLLPPFSAVLARLVELVVTGEVVGSLTVSLGNLAIGLALSLAIGLGVGAAMGWFRSVDYALGPYVNALLTAPSLVFAPIFFSFWGVGRGSIVALIVMYSVFIVIVNTSIAVRASPVDLTEMATSFNATRRQVFRHIVLPAALPLIMVGVRLAVGRSVKGMINGEMFIAVVGLGRLIVSSGRQLDVATVLAVLIVVVVVALAMMRLVWLVEQRLIGWLPETARAG